MKVIVCVDDNGGTMFNRRRQSKDRNLRSYILNFCSGHRLWMSEYSAKQFENDPNDTILVDDKFLEKAQMDDYCFIEGQQLAKFEKDIKQIILCRWNRSYPYDAAFDLSLESQRWNCTSTSEIVGSSHEKITVEVYDR